MYLYRKDTAVTTSYSLMHGKAHGNSKGVSWDRTALIDELSIKRRKKKVIDIVNSNIDYEYQFVTFTIDPKKCDYHLSLKNIKITWDLFRRAFQKQYNCKLKYICVPEQHASGHWHLHVIIFDCNYVSYSELIQLWAVGYIKAEKIQEKSNVAQYIAKYIGKGINGLFKCERIIMRSRNLKNPVRNIDFYETDCDQVLSLVVDGMNEQNIYNIPYLYIHDCKESKNKLLHSYLHYKIKDNLVNYKKGAVYGKPTARC